MGENRALHERPLFPSKQETNSNTRPPVALHHEKKPDGSALTFKSAHALTCSCTNTALTITPLW